MAAELRSLDSSLRLHSLGSVKDPLQNSLVPAAMHYAVIAGFVKLAEMAVEKAVAVEFAVVAGSAVLTDHSFAQLVAMKYLHPVRCLPLLI